MIPACFPIRRSRASTTNESAPWSERRTMVLQHLTVLRGALGSAAPRNLTATKFALTRLCTARWAKGRNSRLEARPHRMLLVIGGETGRGSKSFRAFGQLSNVVKDRQ